jgi:aspartyl-tRNA(Asn)/glutamyl-tRNA(Gln) amidotransferase subunit A
MPLSWSLDHVGVFSRSVSDAALVLQIVSGHDHGDPRSADVPAPDFTPAKLAAPPRLGLLRGFWEERSSDEVGRHIEDVIASLARAGAQFSQVEAPFSVEDVFAIRDGILRYEAAKYHEPNFRKFAIDYGPNIRRLIEAGLEVSEGDYESARKAQSQFREVLGGVLKDVDVLLLPVAPSTAPAGLESTGDPVFCAPASIAGLPSISLPSGVGDAGLPLAVQLIGRAFDEPQLLRVSAWVEDRLGFEARPPI